MEPITRDVATMPWGPAAAFYGPGVDFEGQPVVQLKILSDRRAQGGGIAWLLRVAPPAGKLVKIIAVARSDEHIWTLEGGRATKSGEIRRGAGTYGLNTTGQPHSALITEETVALVIYNGEPDEVRAVEVIDRDSP